MAFNMQTIARFGKWLKTAMLKSYLLIFKPDGLLALADWEGAAQKR